jgi:hypothetical protein
MGIPSETYQSASTIMHKAFDWKRSRIPMLEVQALAQNYISHVQIGLNMVLYMRNLLLLESFVLCPNNQFILVRVIRICFHITKICLRHPTKVQPEIIDIFFLGELYFL